MAGIPEGRDLLLRPWALTQEILKRVLKISNRRQYEGAEWIYLAEWHNIKPLGSIKGRGHFEQLSDVASHERLCSVELLRLIYYRHRMMYIY